ncbi:DUF1140 family protein [Staphylococcus sp. GDY8P131P]|uniref:DUF1140 family protein n=1 Tax=Staphylococcus sp. GDY8P131P TaxID=2804159 RepID=UPI001AEBD180|nr:DUF1140 family protein [Staphylococcus sp. GDY8P131P]
MTPNDILLKNSDLIVKSLFQRADRTYKQFLKYSNTSYEAEVGTSRYWKAISSMEQSQFEFNDYMKQLKFMDELTQWSDKLHQDRYKFVEKYDIVMEKYKLS